MRIRYVVDTHVHADHLSTGSDRSAFIAAMLRDVPPAPPNAAQLRATNLGLTPK